jgi:NADPH-dependent 2,4-dienoyl-CoA reductase/sulfur reductase-like enzyme
LYFVRFNKGKYMTEVGVAVIGGGPAGLAAAIAAERAGAKTALIERESRLGGILKQCIHDGFGLIRFGEKFSGPEYSYRYIEELRKTNVQVYLQTFVIRIMRQPGGFELVLSGSSGIEHLFARALVLSTGCRERTAAQASIYGTRPAGVMTAGVAQYYTNILGQLPCRRCVILGSGDIGLIMARRLLLEGAEVLGVYEAKQTPSGLSRNIAQCLDDFDIPLYTGRTVSRVFGHGRLEAVEIVHTDKAMQVVSGTEKRIECDGLILSVGLIPENELAESLGVPIHPATKGPVCDQHCMTTIPGVFSCGNALLVNDLVDYVSESGEEAGHSAARFALNVDASSAKRNTVTFVTDDKFLCLSPQLLDMNRLEDETTVYFRSREERGKTRIRFIINGKDIFSKQYNQLRPPEMERLCLNLEGKELQNGDTINVVMEDWK